MATGIARCIERSLPMSRFSVFLGILLWVAGKVNSCSRFLMRLSINSRVLVDVSIRQPRMSFWGIQLPSPAFAFLMLIKYFNSPGREGCVSFIARSISSDTLVC